MTRKIKNIKNQEFTTLSSVKKGVSKKSKIKYLKKIIVTLITKNIFSNFSFCNFKRAYIYKTLTLSENYTPKLLYIIKY